MKEGTLMKFLFIILRTKVLHCQHGKARKTSGKIKIQEAKAGKGKLIVC